MLGQIIGQVLGHAFGQRGDEHPFAARDAQMDLRKQIVDLGRGRTDLDFRVDQAGGPHHLLHDLTGMRLLVGTRRGGHEDRLGGDGLEFVESQGPVVERGRQPEAVLDQRLLA